MFLHHLNKFFLFPLYFNFRINHLFHRPSSSVLTRPSPEPTNVDPPDEKNNLGKLSMLWCHVLLFKLNIPFKVVSLFNVVIPDTFNELLTLVLLFNVVVPDTYNILFIVVIFFNVVTPETFNDDVHVVLLFNVVTPDTFNELFIVVILSNFVIPDTCNELFIFVSILFIVQILE